MITHSRVYREVLAEAEHVSAWRGEIKATVWHPNLLGATFLSSEVPTSLQKLVLTRKWKTTFFFIFLPLQMTPSELSRRAILTSTSPSLGGEGSITPGRHHPSSSPTQNPDQQTGRFPNACLDPHNCQVLPKTAQRKTRARVSLALAPWRKVDEGD